MSASASRTAAALVLLALLASAAAAQEPAPRRYLLDAAHSIVWFEARATLGAFRGETRVLRGWAELADPADLRSARGAVEIEAATLKTGIGLRDRHLRAELETETYPRIGFRLTAAAPADSLPGSVTLRGTLSVKATTVEITIPAQLALAGDTLRVRGRVPVRFTQLAMKPPTRLLGTTRVRDELILAFEAAFIVVHE